MKSNKKTLRVLTYVLSALLIVFIALVFVLAGNTNIFATVGNLVGTASKYFFAFRFTPSYMLYSGIALTALIISVVWIVKLSRRQGKFLDYLSPVMFFLSMGVAVYMLAFSKNAGIAFKTAETKIATIYYLIVGFATIFYGIHIMILGLNVASEPIEKKAIKTVYDEKGQIVVGGPSFEKGKSYKGVAIASKVFIYVFLSIFAVIMLVPFVFMITMSLRDPNAYHLESTAGTVSFISSKLTFVNFKIILGNTLSAGELGKLPEGLRSVVNQAAASGNSISFIPYFVNTIIVATISTVFTVITTVFTAFAFARLDFKGKDFLFTLLLGTMMIPGEIVLITNIATVQSMNMHNTFSSLIFVHGVSVFYIFQLRQTFQQIPNELFLAAKVDGYGEFRYLQRVMIPMGMSTIVTIIILNFMGSWNALLWPNAIARENNRILFEWFGIKHPMRLVSNGLMEFFSGNYSNFDTVKLAGSMIISLPLLLIFVFFRKYIMKGVSRSGIKG